MKNAELLRQLGWDEELIEEIERGAARLTSVAQTTIEFREPTPLTMSFSTSSVQLGSPWRSGQ